MPPFFSLCTNLSYNKFTQWKHLYIVPVRTEKKNLRCLCSKNLTFKMILEVQIARIRKKIPWYYTAAT